MDGVSPGEKIIKDTYEAIRNSPHWESSLLIITWDEHGGFYDHAIPPDAVPPGDTEVGSKYNHYGFNFKRYGVPVPAIVVSPLIPANTIDHRLYDHSSIPATIERAFELKNLTDRDKAANDVLSLLSLGKVRADAPTKLPDPAGPVVSKNVHAPKSGTVDSGNLPMFVHVAMRNDLALSSPGQRHAILQRVQAIQTREQVAQYIAEVDAKVKAARAAPYDLPQAQATPES